MARVANVGLAQIDVPVTIHVVTAREAHDTVDVRAAQRRVANETVADPRALRRCFGLTTALGIFLVLSPLAVLIALLVFVAVLWKWRYVSLASISAAALVPFLVGGLERSLPLFAASLFIAGMVVLRHRANIARLRAGTESRFRA